MVGILCHLYMNVIDNERLKDGKFVKLRVEDKGKIKRCELVGRIEIWVYKTF